MKKLRSVEVPTPPSSGRKKLGQPVPLSNFVSLSKSFWPGEAEHQDYFRRTPWSGYCQVVIAPKVAKFRKQYLERLKA